MYDIITIGSATIDAFVKIKEDLKKHEEHWDIVYHGGEKMLVDDFILETGGGGTNTAVAFSRLGLKTACIAVVGPDNFGEDILKELYQEKVDFLGKVKDGKTGFSVILPGKDDRVILSFKGVNNLMTWQDIHSSLLDTKWLYISSMLGKSLETIEEIFAWSRRHNVKIAFNISEYLARNGLKFFKPLLLNTNIFVLNKDEASLLTGKKSINEIISSLSFNPDCVIAITDGHNEIMVSYGKKLFKKSVKKVKPVDTTGAGDAFASGFVYSIINNQSISKALDLGCKEALSVLMHIGAKPGLLRHI